MQGVMHEIHDRNTMYYIEKTATVRLFCSRETITIAKTDPHILERLSIFGYPLSQLAEGEALYEAAHAAHAKQKALVAVQMQATDRVKTAVGELRTVFKVDRMLVRELVGNKRSDREPYGLNASMFRHREKLIDQATRFYTVMQNDGTILSQLEDLYRIKTDFIDARLLRVQTLVDALSEQQVARAEAQLATMRRDRAMKQLDAWMSKLIGIARHAFEQEPAQLEKLGIKVAK